MGKKSLKISKNLAKGNIRRFYLMFLSSNDFINHFLILPFFNKTCCSRQLILVIQTNLWYIFDDYYRMYITRYLFLFKWFIKGVQAYWDLWIFIVLRGEKEMLVINFFVEIWEFSAKNFCNISTKMTTAGLKLILKDFLLLFTKSIATILGNKN